MDKGSDNVRLDRKFHVIANETSSAVAETFDDENKALGFLVLANTRAEELGIKARYSIKYY